MILRKKLYFPAFEFLASGALFILPLPFLMFCWFYLWIVQNKQFNIYVGAPRHGYMTWFPGLDSDLYYDLRNGAQPAGLRQALIPYARAYLENRDSWSWMYSHGLAESGCVAGPNNQGRRVSCVDGVCNFRRWMHNASHTLRRQCCSKKGWSTLKCLMPIAWAQIL